MKKSLIEVLICPRCKRHFSLEQQLGDNEEIEHGVLRCGTGHQFFTNKGVPKFAGEQYTDSFALQWSVFSKTQVDFFNGTDISKKRFFRETNWSPEWMRGKNILDAGCGTGRFSQIALDAGATVFACDLSAAATSCRSNLISSKSLHVIQCDLLNLPFPEKFFDGIFSMGVLENTPDPSLIFKSLIGHLKPGGKLAVDITRARKRYFLLPKYWFRLLSKKKSSEEILEISKKWTPDLLRMQRRIGSIPVVGNLLGKFVPINDYKGRLPLSDVQCDEWSVLDLYDALSTFYENPVKPRTLRRWFKESGLQSIEVVNQGVLVGRGEKPLV